MPSTCGSMSLMSMTSTYCIQLWSDKWNLEGRLCLDRWHAVSRQTRTNVWCVFCACISIQLWHKFNDFRSNWAKKNANSSNSALQTRRAPVLRSRTRFTREKAPLFNLNHLREQSKWSNMGGTVLTRVLFARLIIPHKSHTYSFPSPAKMGIHMYWFPHVQLQILSQARSLWQPVAGGVWP